MAKRLVYLFPLLVLAGTAHALHRSAQASQAEARLEKPLPNANILRFLSSSHRTSVADMYWLHLVQYVGTPEAQEAGWPELEALADLVTTLDPEYGYAYQAAGVLLTEAGRYEASNEILGKGMENVPDRWQLPFYAGFNHWNHLDNLPEAGRLIARAAQLEGGPAYLSELSTRLYASAGDVDEGLRLLDLMIEETEDPLMREGLQSRRGDLLVEQALQRVERAMEAFEATEGRRPRSLQELAQAMPAARQVLGTEIGQTIRLDAYTGLVASPLLPERLVVYDPDRKVPDLLAK